MLAVNQHASTTAGYIPQVDGLRALAALSVVLFHEGDLPYGWGGVWVFFVISGFVITRMMISRNWTLSFSNYDRFAKGRIARIWPLYFLYISLALALIRLSDNGFAGGWPEVYSLVTFTRNFANLGSSFTHTFSHLWSISVEQQFYLVYPFIFAWAVRAERPAPVLGGVLLACFALRCAVWLAMLAQGVAPEQIGPTIYLFSIGHFDAFMAGALAAFYPAQLVRLRAGLAALALGLVAFGFAVALGGIDYAALPNHSLRTIIEATRPTLGIHPYAHGAMVWCYVLLVVAGAALLAQAIGPDSLVKRALGWPPLVRTGQISFGIYVWQGIVAPAFFQTLGVNPHTATLPVRLVTMLGYLALLWGVAAASYALFERRFHGRIGLRLAHAAPALDVPALAEGRPGVAADGMEAVLR